MARVEDVPHAIAQAVGGDDGDQETQSWKESDPPASSKGVLETIRDHRAPFRGGDLGAQPDKTQGSQRQDGISERERSLDKEGGKHIRDNMVTHDAHM